MKKNGKIIEFDGRFGRINGEQNYYDFHISDLSNNKEKETIQIGDTVEFRPEFRPHNISRAKNIKILQKNHIRNSQEIER